MSVLAKGIEQEMEILRRRFFPDEGLNIVERSDRLTSKAGGYQPADEDKEGGRSRGNIVIFHLDD